MTLIRRLILALALIAGITPSFAQVPPPVPALPDTERRTAYSIAGSTCACAVNFALYGDSTDYQNWIEVWLNGGRVSNTDPLSGWTLTSPSGLIANLARPISDAIVTFNIAQTGTVQIVGARRPRRVSQYSENTGVPARNLNQDLTDIVAQNRETWDKLNDVTGRAVVAPPGETLSPLPPLASRSNQNACFNGSGSLVPCASIGSTSIIAGTGVAFTGSSPLTINTNLSAGSGISISGTNPQVIAAVGAGLGQYATRAAAILATVPASVTSIFIEGYAAANDGGAGFYNRLASPPGTIKAWHFQSADGTWWQLAAGPVLPRQVGALLDGSTDDTIAMQAWLDYGGTFGVVSFGQAGTAVIPTGVLNLLSGETVDGGNVLTIKRTTNVVASLMDCNIANTTPQSNIIVRNTTFTTTAGFSGTGSNAIANSSQTFTVPAGLGLTVGAGNFVQVTANSSTGARVNYEIGTITAYSGTSLTVSVSTAVGTGTFSAWLIDVYPFNGDLVASNIGLRFTACNNIKVEHNTVTGRFYNAIDTRNGNDVIFTQNIVSGHVNRGLHMGAYLTGNSAANNQATFNRIDGQSFSQYGINTSASDSAVGIGYLIHGNRIVNTTFQGIIIGAGVTFSEISTNSVQMAFNSNGAAILAEGATGTGGFQSPSQLTITGNTIVLGAQGIFIADVLYSTISGNTINGAGVGILLSGATGADVAFNTITGNVIQGSVSHGLQLSAGAASGVTGHSIVGNTLIANGGWGIISNSNTSNNNYGGNVAIANTSGAYSIAGTGNVTTGGNL